MPRGKIYIVHEGLKELMDQFRKLPEEIGEKSKDAFNQFAAEIMSESVALVPYDPTPKLLRQHPGAFKEGYTKHLKDSAFIRKAEAIKNPTTWFGYGAPHAFLVENDIAGYGHVGEGKRGPSGELLYAKGYSTPGTGPKFLARPTKKRQGQLEARIKQIIEEACKNASS